ncbi:triosephosphate isomerase [Sphingobium sp. B2D3A]|uniref:triose-phosphate isomerase n=1 Tax=Sphingobium TaxID=165695 RepID=UPI0015EC6A06|nr:MULTISPECIES: triose-phosphate isomerase [Sphingobium]MCW2335883.1 triosephosphate isomerase [Sphingobium sp. B2D3A]MCW2364042.1 triosephosphate isomerase [Sphingobium sp. B10D3B]MCW2385642.1 triosephosphate isomerase [Sphingobium sp. B2D3D]MCW2402561.1 triosephosphate isomerase [Sphingobium sp. B10D7B]MCW2409540.1 triosephosphate isomerase [Sphingobium xanthum]
MTVRRKFVAGNWKMNGLKGQLGEVSAIAELAAARNDIDVALYLPATLIAPAAPLGGAVLIGAQDCHQAEAGAYTGNLSAAMLAEAGARGTLVGHSERRQYQRESNADVAAKALAAHKGGLSVVLCVGETLDTREQGDDVAHAFVADQLVASLPEGADPQWLTIAYEPVWAIGTGKVATPPQIAAMHAALRAALVKALGAEAGNAMRILYGGSVSGDNAADILHTDNVDGALVGGASLTAAKFGPIIAAA